MRQILFFIFFLALMITACMDDESTVIDDEMMGMDDLTGIPYEPVVYDLVVPCNFPEMQIPADNPLTVDGVELGRFLFYDPILSADSTQSCASCHAPNGSFADNLAVSVGIDGIAGRRSSMSLLNVGYFYTGLFWDGRVTTLEEQALLPVEDPIEMHHSWPDVVMELQNHDFYPKMFREAFGISSTEEISKELAAKAIAQFERTLVSSGQSKYDRAKCEPGYFPEPQELEGEVLFSFEEADHPGCTHCHKAFNQIFSDGRYLNNGIEDVGSTVEDLENFPDKGRGEVTGNVFDYGKFRVPTLRNIAMSAPYMHDGRFNTLGEVLDHYSSGGFDAANSDPNLAPFGMTPDEKAALISFLNTLTDTAFMNNPAHQNPF
ncbi:MAG: cytochrome c peroxidase [Saprospiraceae bacterium]|jgi:cytochrome c peroxidase